MCESNGELQLRWIEETRRFDGCDWQAAEEIVDTAELAPELALYDLMIEEDPNFEAHCAEWQMYVFDKEIWLPLEQGCHDGVLLPTEQRMMRLRTCPEPLMRPYRWLLELCPPHVKHWLALEFYLRVRLDRVERTGSPEWRAKTAVAEAEEAAFFRPPVLRTRNYAR